MEKTEFNMIDIKEVADNADLIVNGYAFAKFMLGFRFLNLNRLSKAVVFTEKDEMLGTSKDDIELRIARKMSSKSSSSARRRSATNRIWSAIATRKSATNCAFIAEVGKRVSGKMAQYPLINGKKVGAETISKMVEIVNMLAAGKTMTTESIAKSLSLSSPTVRAYLQKLRELELVKAYGSNKNRTYSIGDIFKNDNNQ